MGVGHNIKMLREEKGLSQRELAKMLDVSRGCVSQWETGISKPRMGKVEMLAGVFGVPVSVVVSDEASEKTSMEEELLYAFRCLDEKSMEIALAVVKSLGAER